MRASIEGAGPRLLYLPLCSLDFNRNGLLKTQGAAKASERSSDCFGITLRQRNAPISDT